MPLNSVTSGVMSRWKNILYLQVRGEALQKREADRGPEQDEGDETALQNVIAVWGQINLAGHQMGKRWYRKRAAARGLLRGHIQAAQL